MEYSRTHEEPSAAGQERRLHLSELLGAELLAGTGESVGKLDDVIVRLGADYPPVTGLVAKVGHRRVFIPIGAATTMEAGRVLLTGASVDLRSFERREGEVLLREDILRHRLIDVAEAELVRAWDIELHQRSDGGWVLSCLDTRRPARLFGLIPVSRGQPCRDWKAFEALVGHEPTALVRATFGRLRRLKPAQIADLLEDASRQEGEEILDVVHTDPELEADVFEELDPDTATRFFGDMSNQEAAEVIARMRPDDAADAVADLPQGRRQPVLDHLPSGIRAKVLTLMGFNETSAGGIMGLDFVSAPPDASVEEALRRVRLAEGLQPEALLTIHVIDDAGQLTGVATIIDLLHVDPDAQVSDVMDRDPVRVKAETDVVDVTLLMADYNLMTVPVIDHDGRLIGLITVDDVLEATIPEDWRRREPAPHPELMDTTPPEETASGT